MHTDLVPGPKSTLLKATVTDRWPAAEPIDEMHNEISEPPKNQRSSAYKHVRTVKVKSRPRNENESAAVIGDATDLTTPKAPNKTSPPR